MPAHRMKVGYANNFRRLAPKVGYHSNVPGGIAKKVKLITPTPMCSYVPILKFGEVGLHHEILRLFRLQDTKGPVTTENNISAHLGVLRHDRGRPGGLNWVKFEGQVHTSQFTVTEWKLLPRCGGLVALCD